MRATSISEKVIIRNQRSTRPWQHVLEPLNGYLLLGENLLKGRKEYAEAWNFGPNNEEAITVKAVIENMKNIWNRIEYTIDKKGKNLHEANLLKLDCSKAFAKLKWQSIWSAEKAIEITTQWYMNYYSNKNVISKKQLACFVNDSRK